MPSKRHGKSSTSLLDLARAARPSDPEYKRLLAFLDLASGFSLAVARYDNPSERDWIIQRAELDASHSRIQLHTIYVDKPDVAISGDFVAAVRSQLTVPTSQAVRLGLMVTGIDTLIEKSPAFINRFNYDRESISRQLPYPLVLWLNDNALNRILKQARDLSQWISTRFDFAETFLTKENPGNAMAVSDSQLNTRDVVGRDFYVHEATQTQFKPRPVYLPSKPINIVGRETYFQKLRAALLDTKGGMFLLSGDPGSGKSTVALQFAWQVQKEFEAVIYQTCGLRSVELIVGELADTLREQMGEQVTQFPTDQKLRAVKQWLLQRRSLLVLDDVWITDVQGYNTKRRGATSARDLQDLLPGSPVSVLFTSRRPSLPWVRPGNIVFVEAFTRAEVEDTFRAYLGVQTVERYKNELLQFAERVQRLPLAVAVGAQLLQGEFGPLDEAARGLKVSNLSSAIHNVPGLLERAIKAQGPAEQQLLAAAAVCSAEGFWLPLVSTIAGLESTVGAVSRNHLVNAGLLRPVDQDRQRFHLHSLVREQMRQMIGDFDSLQEVQTQVLEQLFQNWEIRWKECRECLSEIVPVGQRLFRQGKTGRADAIMNRGYSLARRIGELAIALQIAQSVEELWVASQDSEAKNGLQHSYGNQALILQAWGRLEEAMALHKKEEAISEELGDKDSLQRSYGNQALILQAWGRLEEAMALHKKEEAISEELGDKDSLQRSYGNQALILQAWGRLEEAMTLHKKEEAISEELGDKDSVQISYGNQAGILKEWGRLEEALALYKRAEAISEELGNKDSLQRTYGNQALILQAWGQLEEAFALHKRAEAISEELGNRDSLQSIYGNQALILQQRGRLEEALLLLHKKEAICLELGNREALAFCYWQWAVLAQQMGDQSTARAKFEAALAIFTQLRMPRERDAVQEALGHR